MVRFWTTSAETNASVVTRSVRLSGLCRGLRDQVSGLGFDDAAATIVFFGICGRIWHCRTNNLIRQLPMRPSRCHRHRQTSQSCHLWKPKQLGVVRTKSRRTNSQRKKSTKRTHLRASAGGQQTGQQTGATSHRDASAKKTVAVGRVDIELDDPQTEPADDLKEVAVQNAPPWLISLVFHTVLIITLALTLRRARDPEHDRTQRHLCRAVG